MNISKIAPFNVATFNSVNLRENMAQTRPVLNVAPGYDSVSFSGKKQTAPVLLNEDEAKMAAAKLKSSTSGYRGNFGDPNKPQVFSDKFVNTMTEAVMSYAKDNGQKAIMVAGDVREATKTHAPKINERFEKAGFDTYVARTRGAKNKGISEVATPVAAVATRKFGLPVSVLLTASHNPWTDGGYNFLTDEAAVATDRVTTPLADKMVEIAESGDVMPNAKTRGTRLTFDPYKVYAAHIKEHDLIDFNKIKESGVEIYYEALGGTGGAYFPRLMKENGVKLAKVLNTPAKGPNPDEKNLQTLAGLVSAGPLKVGLATDGDSDRFGVIDEKGNFIDPNDVILLVAYHQIKNGGMKEGTIIRNHATSERIDRLAEYFNNKGEGYDIKVAQTHVGFKFLGDRMLEIEEHGKNVIVAGEESGGLTIGGHIPEKDGFVAVSKIAELIAYENKPLSQILSDMKEEISGNYVSKCINVEFEKEEDKNTTVDSFKDYFDGIKTEIAGYEVDVQKTQNVDAELRRTCKPNGDGTKIYLTNGSSILVRKSGTEPVMRLYVDAKDREVFDNLEECLTGVAKDHGGKIKA